MGYCIDLIVTQAQATVIGILLVVLAGIILHCILTYFLAFVKLDADVKEINDGPEKREIVRILLPLVIVVVVSGFVLPLVITHQGYELIGCIKDEEISEFIDFPWKFILPVNNYFLTVMFDGIFSGILYFLFGIILWFSVGRR